MGMNVNRFRRSLTIFMCKENWRNSPLFPSLRFGIRQLNVTQWSLLFFFTNLILEHFNCKLLINVGLEMHFVQFFFSLELQFREYLAFPLHPWWNTFWVFFIFCYLTRRIYQILNSVSWKWKKEQTDFIIYVEFTILIY